MMMPSQLSNYKSSSFEHLDSKIQKWIWKQGWSELNEIQEQSIHCILDNSDDLIISAPTASGKTEAAFLPILSMASQNKSDLLKVLYVSPLKALINDQFNRIEELTDTMNLSITKWHGDVSQSFKKRFLESPTTILMITPESIESLLLNKTQHLGRLLESLEFIIIDEVHSFIGTERGMHLLSLMNRLEKIKGAKIRRIGLSATLGDFSVAKKYLRWSNYDSVQVLESKTLTHDVQLQLRGYLNKIESDKGVLKSVTTKLEIANDIFHSIRGYNNLVFSNSRVNTEEYSLLLKTECEELNVPNEFFPHYSNLSKEVREHLESRLKKGNVPTTAVCTSTLELGIDIGQVKSIVQVGNPPSVSSFRQRLGRSGRRNEPSIIRLFISENEITNDSSLQDLIRAELVQTIAVIELLIEKWYEPADTKNHHLSTLIQQILSIICQYGGAKASSIYQILVDEGPFNVSSEVFLELLKVMGKGSLITQDSSGIILLGNEGEFITEHYSFYSVFHTPAEYTLENNGRVLGTLPIIYPIIKGQSLIFNAQRWVVFDVDPKRNRIYLNKSKGGKPPKFFGSVALIHKRIRQKMFSIYCSNEIPTYLNKAAQSLLNEARKYFMTLHLDQNFLIKEGNKTIVVVWDSDKTINTIFVLLIYLDYVVSRDGLTIYVEKSTPNELLLGLKGIISNQSIDEIKLAALVNSKTSEKYDEFLDENLMNLEYASKFLDLESAKQVISEIVISQ